jgi:protein-L-isoaspartate(D-aspartate) O-methyltransferase
MNQADWRQMNLWSPGWQAAEAMAASYLGPALSAAEDTGLLTGWWFTRKGPGWRLRLQPAPGQHHAAEALVHSLSSELAAGHGIRATRAIYEPETRAFGGTVAMTAAHRLFHADSRHILAHLAQPGGEHRRELALILAATLLRAASQDWYEQGDVWQRVAAHRAAALPPGAAPADAVRVLITGAASTPASPLAAAPGWPAAFAQAGEVLAGLERDGRLVRGLRAVLAHHVLFAWNRLGISAEDQQLLAATAATIVFATEPVSSCRAEATVTTLSAVTTNTTPAATLEPGQLRDTLADHIAGRGTFRTPQVEKAFRTVPRHLFLPGTGLQEAYAPQVVITRRGPDGAATSSASDPNLVAAMLEQLAVRPGDRVLEIGAGTGFNAALLAELAGPDGQVTTIDIDQDITDAARRSLAQAGYGRVRVICADGAGGHPAGGLYDRIIVTAGAWDLPAAWWHQLAGHGRIVVPLRLDGSGLTRAVALDRQPGGYLTSDSALVCGFVPMRGSAASTGRTLQLADGVTLSVDAADKAGEEALAGLPGQTVSESWTGITIGDSDTDAPHLDLWLATNAPAGVSFGRISAADSSPLIAPSRRWAGAAVHDGNAIAYLTLRLRAEGVGELGVAACGKDSDQLAARTAGLLRDWSRARPVLPVITAHPAGTPDSQLPPGTRFSRPDSRLTVSWGQPERT